MNQIPQDEINKLSKKFADICANHFPKTNGDRSEIARQMLTTLAALTFTIQIIKEHAQEIGITVAVECVSQDEFLKRIPTQGQH